jgi:hypothetical protein
VQYAGEPAQDEAAEQAERQSGMLREAVELACTGLLLQLFANRFQLLPPRRADRRVTQLQTLQRIEHYLRHDLPRVVLVVGRHDKPGRVRGTGCAQGMAIGLHVGVPVLTLGDVAAGSADNALLDVLLTVQHGQYSLRDADHRAATGCVRGQRVAGASEWGEVATTGND